MGSLDKYKPVHSPPTESGGAQNDESFPRKPYEDLKDFFKERPGELKARINWWRQTNLPFKNDEERYIDYAGDVADEPTYLAYLERLAEWIPEADIEKVMQKVQDIDQKGTAYHVQNMETNKNFWEYAKELESFLHAGIVPTFHGPLRRQMHGVGFNVIGWPERYTDYRSQHAKRTSKNDLREIGSFGLLSAGRIAILFNLTPFKETQPGPEYYTGEQPGLRGTYRVPGRTEQYADLPHDGNRPDLVSGMPKTSTGMGFQLFGQVSPQLFRGIVIYPFGGNNESEWKGGKLPTGNVADVQRQTLHVAAAMLTMYADEKINEMAKERGIKMSRTGSGERKSYEYLLPIYDPHGNLLWPKQMSYAEVKQYVAKRDSKDT